MKNYIKQKLPWLFTIYKYSERRSFCKNYFRTRFPKNVLVSYITKPFKQGVSFKHTNTAECLAIAEIFKDNGYNVDVVNHDSDQKIDYTKYDIVFGFGQPLVKSFRENSKTFLRIFYGTGMHPRFSNSATIKRLQINHQETKQWFIESSRLVESDYLLQTTAVDGMIVIGGQNVLNTYQKYYVQPIELVPVSFYKVFSWEKISGTRNNDEAKKNFLFFSGAGMVHKGLDLLLRVFRDNPTLQLHICAPLDAEVQFKKYYYDDLYKRQNIHTYGLIDINSKKFESLLKQCAFTVLPSCSEGEPSSLINVVGNGALVPLTTLDAYTSHDFGITISEGTVQAVATAVQKAAAMSSQIIRQQCEAAARYVNEHNSLVNFSKQFSIALQKILDDKGQHV